VTVSGSDTVLAADGIHKRFGALAVLADVNFAMGRNEAVGIVGPNGAGKTTFLRVLVGAHSPQSGTITFKGENVTTLSAADRCRQGLVYTHQVPKPFSGMTVFENVFVAAANQPNFKRDAAYQEAINAISLVGMIDVANRRAETLGLLDRKRLELARALATRPEVLLLDEIGGGLSEGEGNELVAIIKQLRNHGIAIVWIEHIVHLLLQVTDRLICMDAGRIIADGAPQDVLADKSVIEAYLGGSAQ